MNQNPVTWQLEEFEEELVLVLEVFEDKLVLVPYP